MQELSKEITDAAKAIARSIGTEAAAVNSLRDFNERQSVVDPAKVAWPATLPIELALKTAPPVELKAHYGFSDEEWLALKENQVFLNEVAAMMEAVKQEGMSFKLKCKLQAEGMLETNWRMVHAPHTEVPAASKVKLMEATWRMAGYDNKDAAAAGGSNLAIQINFGGGQASASVPQIDQ